MKKHLCLVMAFSFLCGGCQSSSFSWGEIPEKYLEESKFAPFFEAINEMSTKEKIMTSVAGYNLFDLSLRKVVTYEKKFEPNQDYSPLLEFSKAIKVAEIEKTEFTNQFPPSDDYNQKGWLHVYGVTGVYHLSFHKEAKVISVNVSCEDCLDPSQANTRYYRWGDDSPILLFSALSELKYESAGFSIEGSILEPPF